MRASLCTAVLSLLAAAACAPAAVVIDASTLNGSFENGTGDTTVTDWRAPNDNGLNPKTGTYVIYRQNSNPDPGGGDWNLFVAMANGEIRGGAIDTEHTISAGEYFELSFDHWYGTNTDSDEGIAWRMYTTDNNAIDGAATLFEGGWVQNQGSGDSRTWYHSGTFTTGTAGAAVTGKTLFLAMVPSYTFQDNEWARIDLVELSAIPEPATLALLALGGVALLRRRRAGR